jgi:hypothetical protein
MGKADPKLIQTWNEAPHSTVPVIVHVRGDPGNYTELMGELGLTVVRAFRLTHTIAARGEALRVLNLLAETWVERIEADRTITTMA